MFSRNTVPRASRQSEILTRSSKTQVLPPSLYRTNYVQYHYLLFHRAFAKNYWVSSLFFPSLSLLIPYIAFLYFVLSNYHVQCTVIKEHEKGRESTQTFKYPDLEAGLEILPSLSKVPRSILIQCTTWKNFIYTVQYGKSCINTQIYGKPGIYTVNLEYIR